MSRDDHTNANGEDNSREQSWDKSWENFNANPQEGTGDAHPSPYGPTSHPEDAPGGFQGYNQGMVGEPYPQTPYPNQNSYQGYNAAPINNGVQLEPGSGTVDIMRAVRFGFRTTFSNPVVWILGTVLLGLGFMILSGLAGYLAFVLDPEAVTDGSNTSPTMIVFNVLIVIVACVMSICVMRGALLAVDGHKTRYADFFRPINVGQTALLMIVLGIISAIVSTLPSMLSGELAMVDEATGMVEVNNSALGMFFIYLFALALIGPLYSFWVYYTADGQHTAMSAARTGFKDALRNYPRLLLFTVVGGLAISIIGFVTLLFGFVILLPAYTLAVVHIYRQMSGGNIPVEQQ